MKCVVDDRNGMIQGHFTDGPAHCVLLLKRKELGELCSGGHLSSIIAHLAVRHEGFALYIPRLQHPVRKLNSIEAFEIKERRFVRLPHRTKRLSSEYRGGNPPSMICNENSNRKSDIKKPRASHLRRGICFCTRKSCPMSLGLLTLLRSARARLGSLENASAPCPKHKSSRRGNQ